MLAIKRMGRVGFDKKYQQKKYVQPRIREIALANATRVESLTDMLRGNWNEGATMRVGYSE